MSNQKEPTQTTPKGAEIPVPTRRQVLGDLDKAMRPVEKPKKKRRPRSKS